MFELGASLHNAAIRSAVSNTRGAYLYNIYEYSTAVARRFITALIKHVFCYRDIRIMMLSQLPPSK